MCATILEEKFSYWVKLKVDTRHEKVADKKDIMIKMDPAIAEIFRQSTAVSSTYRLLKIIIDHSYFL